MSIVHTTFDEPSISDLAPQVPVWRVDAQGVTLDSDQLIQERPIAITYNGINYATMLTTPNDLEDFAIGFSLTEGIITSIDDLRHIECVEHPDGLVLDVELAPGLAYQLKEKKRALAGKTGCGLCGVETLDQVAKPRRLIQSHHADLSLKQIMHAMKHLSIQQRLHTQTGACHAAAWWDAASSSVIHVLEDVGRHNALDKLIGRMMRLGISPDSGCVLVSSRASYEMVQKCMILGASCLVAVSAPTKLAYDLALEIDMTLVGFVRGEKSVIYHHPQRFFDI